MPQEVIHSASEAVFLRLFGTGVKLDLQTIINYGAGGILAFVGFLARRAIINHDRVADELTAFRLDVARNYVTHQDLGDIKDTLRRIEDMLHKKADRQESHR